MRVLSRLFRRRFLEELAKLQRAAALQFFGEYTALADPATFGEWLAPLRQCEWVVYAKRPFAGPAAVLAYLARYTHRVAISNQRLIAMDERGVTFRWKDYRLKAKARYKTMTLAPEKSNEHSAPTFTCPDCGAPMTIIQVFTRAQLIRAPPRLQSAA